MPHVMLVKGRENVKVHNTFWYVARVIISDKFEKFVPNLVTKLV